VNELPRLLRPGADLRERIAAGVRRHPLKSMRRRQHTTDGPRRHPIQNHQVNGLDAFNSAPGLLDVFSNPVRLLHQRRAVVVQQRCQLTTAPSPRTSSAHPQSRPTSSACPCERNSRVLRISPSNREHDRRVDAGHRLEVDHRFVPILAQRPDPLRSQVVACALAPHAHHAPSFIGLSPVEPRLRRL
jgi:hypothetical protein